jgi:hypothetical protein
MRKWDDLSVDEKTDYLHYIQHLRQEIAGLEMTIKDMGRLIKELEERLLGHQSPP